MCFHISLETHRGILSAQTRLLDPAEWDKHIDPQMMVHPGGSHFQPLSKLGAALEIVRPDRSAKTKTRIIGSCDGIFDVGKPDNGKHRPEGFVIDKTAALADPRDDRRLDKVSAIARNIAP